MKYNYLEAMKDDIREYINENVERGQYTDRDEAEQQLNDDLWTVDSVTGNGSGSYTFNRYTAKEYVEADGEEYLREALREFCVDADTVAEKFLDADYEYFDVTIRCYLLGQALAEVLDELEENGFFDEEEEEEEETEE